MELLRYDAAQCEVFEEPHLFRDIQHAASATWIELEILVLHIQEADWSCSNLLHPLLSINITIVWFVWMHNLIRDVVV